MRHHKASLNRPLRTDLVNTPRAKYRRLGALMADPMTPAWPKALVAEGARLLPQDRRRHAVVDVKPYVHLGRGDAPCIIGWHYDCTKAPGPVDRDSHAMVQFEWPDEGPGPICPALFRDGQAAEGIWLTYGCEEHSAQRAMRQGARLLVRVTYSPIFAGATP